MGIFLIWVGFFIVFLRSGLFACAAMLRKRAPGAMRKPTRCAGSSIPRPLTDATMRPVFSRAEGGSHLFSCSRPRWCSGCRILPDYCNSLAKTKLFVNPNVKGLMAILTRRILSEANALDKDIPTEAYTTLTEKIKGIEQDFEKEQVFHSVGYGFTCLCSIFCCLFWFWLDCGKHNDRRLMSHILFPVPFVCR